MHIIRMEMSHWLICTLLQQEVVTHRLVHCRWLAIATAAPHRPMCLHLLLLLVKLITLLF